MGDLARESRGHDSLARRTWRKCTYRTDCPAKSDDTASSAHVPSLRATPPNHHLEIAAFDNLALDSAGNIYVLNDLNLLKFAPNATGNVAPIATITTATRLVQRASHAQRFGQSTAIELDASEM